MTRKIYNTNMVCDTNIVCDMIVLYVFLISIVDKIYRRLLKRDYGSCVRFKK